MDKSSKEYYLLSLRKLVLNYVAKYPIKVYLYGSRAKDKAHKTSDVDIALLSDIKLPVGFVSGLKELIEESTIPYQVDIVDLSQVDNEFRNKVLAEAILWSD